MADKGWKKFERRVATFFNSVRNSLSGINSKHSASDTLHPDFFIECKLRQAHAHHTTLAEAGVSARGEGKLPVLVTQKYGSPRTVVSIYMDDLPTFCRKFLEGRGYRVVRNQSSSPSPRKESDDLVPFNAHSIRARRYGGMK